MLSIPNQTQDEPSRSILTITPSMNKNCTDYDKNPSLGYSWHLLGHKIHTQDAKIAFHLTQKQYRQEVSRQEPIVINREK
jgi:hypothetical protein